MKVICYTVVLDEGEDNNDKQHKLVLDKDEKREDAENCEVSCYELVLDEDEKKEDNEQNCHKLVLNKDQKEMEY